MASTMRQIALECGVSLQTVSRILRGHYEAYRPETVQQVRTVAKALDYQPPWAQVLGSARRTNCVGLIVRGFGTESQVQAMNSITTQLRDFGYLPVVVPVHMRGDDSDHVADAAQMLADQGAQAVLIKRIAPVRPDVRRRLQKLPVPVVFIGWGPPRWKAKIVFDQHNRTEQIAAHLAGLGHRHAIFIPNSETLDFPEHRIFAYRRALMRHGIELTVRRDWMAEPGPRAANSAYEVVTDIIRVSHPATALLMNNDLDAVAALAALSDCGISVPGHISVMGSDGMSVAQHSRPRITTIRMPAAEVGPAVMDMLGKLLGEDDAKIEPMKLQWQLSPGQTTAAARQVQGEDAAGSILNGPTEVAT